MATIECILGCVKIGLAFIGSIHEKYYDLAGNILGGLIGAIVAIWVLKREFKKQDEERMARCFYDIHFKLRAGRPPKAMLPISWRRSTWPAGGLSCYIMESLADEMGCGCTVRVIGGDKEAIRKYLDKPNRKQRQQKIKVWLDENPGLMISGYTVFIPLFDSDTKKEIATEKPFCIITTYFTQGGKHIRHSLFYTKSCTEEQYIGDRIETEIMEEECHQMRCKGKLRGKAVIKKCEGPLYEKI